MPMSIGEPTPKVDPLLRVRRTDTAENVRQKASTLLMYHDDLEAWVTYNTLADSIDRSGLKTFGEWESQVIEKAGVDREELMAEHEDDPYVDMDDA